ncbi:LPS assembly lipoprotein LptE [Aestuariirhabdus sp. LZHN29]|uniref:LPS-assembly lipoprotein LptE n=1 Tax=Aestuariirhabdus sp. LZHN29 TaxID=3417462 RepID=UPI003CFAB54B
MVLSRHGSRLPLMALGLLLIAGCGFQLRGEVDLASELRTLNVTGVQSGSNLSRTLRQSLANNGVEISANAVNTLAILDHSSSQRAVTFTGTGESAQYEVTSQIRFSLQNRNGTTLLGPDQQSAQSTYQADQNNTTASISERQLLDRELEWDLVRKVMLRLQAISSTQLAEAHEAATERELQQEQATSATQ